MGPVTAIKTCLRKYIAFSGRAVRSEFWWSCTIALLVFVALWFVDGSVWGSTFKNGPKATFLSNGFAIMMICPLFAMASRRLTDAGIPAALVVLPFLGLWFQQHFYDLYFDWHRIMGTESATTNIWRTLIQNIQRPLLIIFALLLALPTDFASRNRLGKPIPDEVTP